jgi:hypothetical protein
MTDFKNLINILSNSLRFSSEETVESTETPETIALASTTYSVMDENDVAMDIIVEGELVAGSNVMLADGSPLVDGTYTLADGSMEMMVMSGVITSVEPVMVEDMVEEEIVLETALSTDEKIANLESAMTSLIDLVTNFTSEKFTSIENELAETKLTLSKVTFGKAPEKFEKTTDNKVDKFDRIAEILKNNK